MTFNPTWRDQSKLVVVGARVFIVVESDPKSEGRDV
jgi:hypothetical protein